MRSKCMELSEKDNFENFTKEQLISELNCSRFETFKYVNRLLEVEERWVFVNHLLKKLNSIKELKVLCETICDGFLKLTNSKICACNLFNPDTGEVVCASTSFDKSMVSKNDFCNFIEAINLQCSRLMETSEEVVKINEYFESTSTKTSIIVPIIYSKNLLGYLLLAKDEENFYKENIHFVNIFPDHIAVILINIFLYQESEKSNKRKIEFLAGISHEFKTPLNSIIGFSEILQAENTDPKQTKYLKNISRSSKHLLSLIEDVLDVSKTQFDTLKLNYSLFNTKDEIQNIISTFAIMINEKKIKLDYTLSDIKICADVKRFRQLIFNLLSNAVKFNKINGKIVILSYVKDDKFFFEITDTGDGISKQDFEKIFDFFSQVNRNQLKRQLGSGVGLALCKMITDAHNGEIAFKSQLKKGSCFWFSLPLEK